MFARFLTAAMLPAIAAATLVPAAASAQPGYGAAGYQQAGYRDQYRHRGYNKRYYNGRHRCRDNGTGGLVIGGVAGGLLGNAVAGHGDKTLGTVLGAGAGALAGRAIDRPATPWPLAVMRASKGSTALSSIAKCQASPRRSAPAGSSAATVSLPSRGV